MKVLYIHQYFRTPEQGGAIRSYYLATGLAQAGIAVTVLTAQDASVATTTYCNGFQVHYLPVSYSHYYPAWKRIYSFLRFMWAAFRYMRHTPYDICYATSTPLTVGVLALIVRWLYGKKYIFEVRDLWPLAPVQLGYIRSRWLAHFLFWVEKKIYQYAEEIVSLSRPMTEYIQAIVQKPITTVPNISDTDFFEPSPTNICPEKPVIVAYTGTMGRANQVEKLIELARYCQEEQLKVQFYIAGEGTELARLQVLAAKYALKNTFFLGFLDKIGVKKLLQQAHFAYISFADAPVLESCSPNKLFDALAAGVPILSNTAGWIADLITAQQCGFYLPAAQPYLFKQLLQQCYTQPELYQRYCLNARQVAEQTFNKNKAVTQILTIIQRSVPHP